MNFLKVKPCGICYYTQSQQIFRVKFQFNKFSVQNVRQGLLNVMITAHGIAIIYSVPISMIMSTIMLMKNMTTKSRFRGSWR